ncbi:MAG: AAA family ATPase, partial [Acetivibrio ethanolgignens]
AQTIFLAAKARAILEGRYNVAFEDIDFVMLPALRHRLIPAFDAVSEGVSMDFVLEEIRKELTKNR